MAKGFNYTSGSRDNGTVKLRNFVLGVGDQDYGPTSETGYYKAVNVPADRYVIYDIIEGDLYYNIPRNDDEVVSYLSEKRGVTMSTLAEAIYWSSTQDDVFVTNVNYEDIITDGLELNFDPGLVAASPLSGTNVYDLTNNQFTGTVVNSPTFVKNSYGFVRFDGTNSYIKFDSTIDILPATGLSNFTIDVWNKKESGTNSGFGVLVGLGYGSGMASEYNQFISQNLNFQNVNSGQYITRVQPTSEWRNYTYTFSSEGIGKAYLNGIPYSGDGGVDIDGTVNWPELFDGRYTPPFNRLSSEFASSRKICIGYNDAPYVGAYYAGDMGPVKYYSRVLSDEEVLHNYNALYHRYQTVTPTPTLTPTLTPTPTPTITPTLTPTVTPTMTPNAVTYQYDSNTNISWPTATNGYYSGETFTAYTGGWTSIDDGYSLSPIDLGFDFTFDTLTSSSLYIGTNGYASLGSGYSQIGMAPDFYDNLFVVNDGDGYMNVGVTLTDGDVGGIVYYDTGTDSVGSYAKFIATMSAFGQTTTPYSWYLEIYKDDVYQWMVTRAKANILNPSSTTVGPSFSNSTEWQQLTTTSKVWRGNATGTSWTYMGTGSVVLPT